MGRTGRRRRIATGIYADKSGLSAVVTVNRHQKEHRFPPGTDLQTIRDWRRDTVEALEKKHAGGRRGTMGGDAKIYLAQVGHLTSLKARRVEVHAWLAFLGRETLRDDVTSEDVRRARVAWLKAKKKPKTINNRLQTLRHWYLTLDGPDADTPCDGISALPVEKTPPVFIDAELVTRVDAELQRRERANDYHDRKTRARFRVLATTGKRPSEVMRAQPADVDLERRVWIVRDGKGGFSPGLYLNDDMLAAWRLFAEAEAWGDFNTNSMARSLRRAGWPKGVKPYNLRHTTWITASERGADLADVQVGAGHKNIATTRRHYVPVLNSRQQRLSELLDGRFQWATVPSNVPSAVPRTSQKSPKLRSRAHGTWARARSRKSQKNAKKSA